MPRSDTKHLDFYPDGWTEEIHGETYVEWVYDDPDVFVWPDGTDGEGQYVVTLVTGVNERGEEFVTRPIDRLSEEAVFEIAGTLVYILNGMAGRLNEVAEFIGGGQTGD
jgi:hypothetical protein